jgi:hypothetical protein
MTLDGAEKGEIPEAPAVKWHAMSRGIMAAMTTRSMTVLDRGKPSGVAAGRSRKQTTLAGGLGKPEKK